MKVFIENEANTDLKNIFDEETLEFRKTYKVSRKYPFPYGFVLNTKSGDGDCLDCFVLTSKSLKSREVVEVEPIGMFEQIEDGKEDHKILAILPDEEFEIDEGAENILKEFTLHVFDHLPGKNMHVGRFMGKDEALKLLDRSTSTGSGS